MSTFGLGANAVGTRIDIVEGDVRDVEIVGVIANAKYNNVKDPVRAQLFRPRDQLEAADALTFYVCHTGEPHNVIAQIRNVVARLDSSLPIASMQTMDRQIADYRHRNSFNATGKHTINQTASTPICGAICAKLAP